jgi:hypothetical protein
VSNDQSPPPRKVIPYKKGGRRQSPFSDIAFQFSGTALDVAIQQSQEEDAESPQLEDAPSGGENTLANAEPLTLNEIQQVEVGLPTQEIVVKPNLEARKDALPAIAATDPAVPDNHLVGTKESSRRSVSVKRKISQPSMSDPSFQAFVDRWKHGLRRGQLKMCEVLFNKTYAVGLTECETSFSVLMREAGLSRRQSFQIISELEKMGFVERLATLKHSTRKGTGSLIRFHLTPKA